MKSLFDINGKKAIVTGATRGLGFGMAEALLDAGCEVAAVGSTDNIYKTCKEWQNKGYKVYPVKADLSVKEENERTFNTAIDFLSDVDILVCGAGMISRHPSREFPFDEWEKTISLNLNSVFILSQLASEFMIKKGYGKIITVSSMCSYFGGQTVPAYSASKGGVMQLTRALANDWAKYGINVNSIAPGYMTTDMTEGIRTNPERYKDITARIPMGRWGNPDDMKGTVIFLSSRASDYLSGAIIPVDGGYLSK